MSDTVIREVSKQWHFVSSILKEFRFPQTFGHFQGTLHILVPYLIPTLRDACRPFAGFGFWPIGGRSTAVKLQEGGVWVIASTPLDNETKAKLDALGPVRYVIYCLQSSWQFIIYRYIVSPDAVHHLYLNDFKKAYPSAKLLATEAAAKRQGNPDLQFDGGEFISMKQCKSWTESR